MVWNITMVVGVLLSVLAAVLGVREHRWLKGAALADGVVVELVAHRQHGGKSDSRTTYSPRVTFTAPGGGEHTFTGSQGSRPPAYEVGELVKVAYDRATFEGRIMSFGERFGVTVVLAALGLGAIFMSVTFIVGKQLFIHLYFK